MKKKFRFKFIKRAKLFSEKRVEVKDRKFINSMNETNSYIKSKYSKKLKYSGEFRKNKLFSKLDDVFVEDTDIKPLLLVE